MFDKQFASQDEFFDEFCFTEQKKVAQNEASFDNCRYNYKLFLM